MMEPARREEHAPYPAGRVLLVTDQKGDASLIVAALERSRDNDVRWVTSHEAALAELARRDYACVLVHLGLPGVDQRAFAELKLAAVDSAIIVLADESTETVATEMVVVGADDYLLLSDVSTPRFRSVLGAAIDRRRLRRVLQHASARDAAVMEALGDGIIVVGGDGRIVSANRAAGHILGLSPEELIEVSPGEVPWAYIHRDGTPIVSSELATQVTLQSGRPLRDVIRGLRRANGELSWVEVNTHPLRSTHDGVDGVVVAVRDITARRQAEEAARALSVIVESTADAIFTLDLGGTILTWNRGAEDLYGYQAAAMVGTDFNVLGPPGAQEWFATFLIRMGAGESIRGVEVTHRRRDASLVDVSVTASPIRGGDGVVVGASAIVRDISDRRRLERELTRQSMHDSLTGLPNRTLLGDRLSQSLVGAARRSLPVAVLLLDLDQFKHINDAHGHVMGDHLLIEVVRRLRRVIRPSDTMARFGGDEFVILCEDTDEGEAEHVADRLGEALREPVELKGKWLYISASIGIAVSPPLEADADALLRYADVAMYEAKSRGRARSRVFDASLATVSRDRLDLTSDLAGALSRDELEVHYQPVVELTTGRLVGVEALTRWRHPVRGWIPPALFVPLAEENGLIATLDRWVLHRACRDGAALRASGVLPPSALLSVNVSARNVGDMDLVSTIRRATSAANFPLQALELEVTETATMSEGEAIRGVLEDIRHLGVGIALDDFGTGYSSLTYVRQLPVTTIKIDHSFTRHIIERRHDLAIAASVIDLARAVGLRTIAEGVETAAQLAVLHQLGCDAGQGFLWSKALPAEELTALVRDHPKGFLAAAKSPRGRITARLSQDRSGRKRGLGG